MPLKRQNEQNGISVIADKRTDGSEKSMSALDGRPCSPNGSFCCPPPRKQQRRGSHDSNQENRHGKRQASILSTASAYKVVVKEEIKEASTSREMSVLSTVSDFRPPNEIDGKMKGYSLTPYDRDVLEDEHSNAYYFPTYLQSNGDSTPLPARKLRPLDWMLEGEIEKDKPTSRKVYVIAGILAMNKFDALVNWDGFMFPSWQPRQDVKRGPALKEYEHRKAINHQILKQLVQMESDVIANYPNMAIQRFSEYCANVKNPGIVYLSGLYKRERQINELLEERYSHWLITDESAPTTFFVDWTSFEDSSIPTFEHIDEPVMTKGAAEVMDDLLVNRTSCKCKRCMNQSGCCSFKSESKMGGIAKGILGNLVAQSDSDDDSEDEIEKVEPSDYVDMYECGDDCACDWKRCWQRMIQRGRRNTLVVFKHHAKGWTLRAGDSMKRGAFVCEYSGQMMNSQEANNRHDKTYHMEFLVKTNTSAKINKPRMMLLDALHMGNEGRFIAHSCEPNLFTHRVHFDIKGRPKRHIGFFAARDIEAGEELTFDYCPESKKPEDFHKRTVSWGFTCTCGSSKCREAAYQRKYSS